MPNERPKDVLTSGQLRGYRIPGSKDRRIPLNQLIRFMQVHGMPLEGIETGHTRVLILDEECEFTSLFRDALQAEGRYTVEIAATIFEAGVFTHSNRPHAIVADVTMPGLQPKKLCQFLRTSEDFQGVKLIAVSGAMTRGQWAAQLQNGFDAYLPKPFEVRELAKTIDEVTSGTD